MRNAAGTLAGINDVPMEEYLYGVVPRELGPVQYPEAEAQKAQAVAARTYAHANLGKHWNNGYDLLATVQDQVYGGVGGRAQRQHGGGERHGGDRGHLQRRPDQRAVLRHQRRQDLQRARTCSPARTPYLRSVWDAPAGQELPSISALLTDLRTPAWTGAYAGWHSYHRWNYTWTMAQMSCVIGDFANKAVGNVTAINILSRSATSGRVTQIQFVTRPGHLHRDGDGHPLGDAVHQHAPACPRCCPAPCSSSSG